MVNGKWLTIPIWKCSRDWALSLDQCCWQASSLLVLRCVKGAMTRQMNETMPCVAASVAFLLGVHSLVDFSLQMQAIAVTFMALLGAGVAQSESSRLMLGD